jgi:hypothetical protein
METQAYSFTMKLNYTGSLEGTERNMKVTVSANMLKGRGDEK